MIIFNTRGPTHPHLGDKASFRGNTKTDKKKTGDGSTGMNSPNTRSASLPEQRCEPSPEWNLQMLKLRSDGADHAFEFYLPLLQFSHQHLVVLPLGLFFEPAGCFLLICDQPLEFHIKANAGCSLVQPFLVVNDLAGEHNVRVSGELADDFPSRFVRISKALHRAPFVDQ